ncbi:hypothetical protein Micbo1qcDRAFT_170708 [Microdochium bolleyi]|uniref:Uncharacterized protein n=1 Tax=Microdochium bolleyi TaxID=196109 RepID=A0A136JIL9_9PEZI|nr:hypothetical protein Micbo1qcDRAFT_170708 [Microdochium bolleyi]
MAQLSLVAACAHGVLLFLMVAPWLGKGPRHSHSSQRAVAETGKGRDVLMQCCSTQGRSLDCIRASESGPAGPQVNNATCLEHVVAGNVTQMPVKSASCRHSSRRCRIRVSEHFGEECDQSEDEGVSRLPESNLVLVQIRMPIMAIVATRLELGILGSAHAGSEEVEGRAGHERAKSLSGQFGRRSPRDGY